MRAFKGHHAGYKRQADFDPHGAVTVPEVWRSGHVI
jgi:hypothetical protein